jgi:hypothetical protein
LFPCFNPRHRHGAEIFAFTVKKLERLGVSGVVIEDKPFGGHGTHLALSQWDISMEGNQKTHGNPWDFAIQLLLISRDFGKIVEVPPKESDFGASIWNCSPWTKRF